MFKLKTKFFAYAAVLLLVVVLASYKFNHPAPVDAAADKNAVLMKVLMQGLSSAHFHPKKVDDTFSKEVYKTYLERLAFNKKYTKKPISLAIMQNYKFQVTNCNYPLFIYKL